MRHGAGDPAVATAKPFGWRFMAPILVGSAMNPINSSIIATALAAIGRDFGVEPAATASLVSSLYLASAIAQPTMGKLSARFGPRRIFLAGMVVVALGGLVGTVAPGIGYLVLSRVLIGIGTSAGYPTAMALIRQRETDAGTDVPGRALGGLSVTAQMTMAVGLPLGGLIIAVGGWRATFAINLPVAIAGIIAVLMWIPRDRADHRSRQPLWQALDPPGMLLFGGAVAALLVFLFDLARPVWWLLGVVIVLGAVLVWWERRAANPFIDVRMLARNLPLSRTYLRNAITFIAAYSILYGLTQWLEEGRGLTPTHAGLVMLPMTALAVCGSALVSSRNWVRGPLIGTGLSILVGAGLLLLVNGDTNIALLLVVTTVFGVMMGTGSVGNQFALYRQSPRDDIAVASGLLRTSTYVGAVFSSSLVGITFGESATATGLHEIALAMGVIGLVIALAAIFDRAIPFTATRR